MFHGYLSAIVHRQGQPPKQLALWHHNVTTNAGRDAFHALCYTNTSAGTQGFNFIGLTESTITPAASDTTLAGEIVTNGLTRVSATTKSHSAGTNSTLIEHTHTASGSFTDVKASALFVGAGAVTMAHIANYPSGSGTLITNDTLKTSWTLNLG